MERARQFITAMDRDDWMVNPFWLSYLFASYMEPMGLYLLEDAKGIASTHFICTVAGGDAYFMGGRIRPDLQGKGLGGAVVDYYAQFARAYGIRHMLGFVVKDNIPSIRALERNRFFRVASFAIHQPLELSMLPQSGTSDVQQRIRRATEKDAMAIEQILQQNRDQEYPRAWEFISSANQLFVFRRTQPADYSSAYTLVLLDKTGQNVEGFLVYGRNNPPDMRNVLLRRVWGSVEAVREMLVYLAAEMKQIHAKRLQCCTFSSDTELLQKAGLPLNEKTSHEGYVVCNDPPATARL